MMHDVFFKILNEFRHIAKVSCSCALKFIQLITIFWKLNVAPAQTLSFAIIPIICFSNGLKRLNSMSKMCSWNYFFYFKHVSRFSSPYQQAGHSCLQYLDLKTQHKQQVLLI